MKKQIGIATLVTILFTSSAHAQVYTQLTLDSINVHLEQFIKEADVKGDKKVTLEEVNKLIEKKFKKFDSDHKGLTIKEYQTMMFADLDKEAGNSKELVAQLSELKKRFISQEKMIFQAIDTNKDGRIQLDELLVLEKKAFSNMDYNKDGVISMDDFEALKKDHSVTAHK